MWTPFKTAATATPVVRDDYAVQADDALAVAISPEGIRRCLRLPVLFDLLRPTEEKYLSQFVVPDGVKLVVPTRSGLVFVHQTPPQIHNLSWVSNEHWWAYMKDDEKRNSAYRPTSDAEYLPIHSSQREYAKHSSQREYANVAIGLPYVNIVIGLTLTNDMIRSASNKIGVYFSTTPLSGLDDPMFCAALPNIQYLSHDSESTAVPHLRISRMCQGNRNVHNANFEANEDPNKLARAIVSHALGSVFYSAYNYDMDRVGRPTGYGEHCMIFGDPTVSNLSRWQEESAKNPQIGLSLPWVPTGGTLRDIISATWGGCITRKAPEIKTAAQLAKIVFNYGYSL